MLAKTPRPHTFNIAAQGGAAFGSFTQGVLESFVQSQDYQQGNLRINRISATSAGAFNGAIVKAWENACSSPVEASYHIKANLEEFWNGVGAESVRQARNYGFGGMYEHGYEMAASWEAICKSAMMIPPDDFSFNTPNVNPFYLTQMKQSCRNNRDICINETFDRLIRPCLPDDPDFAGLTVNAVRKRAGSDEPWTHIVYEDDEIGISELVKSATLTCFGSYLEDGYEYYDGAYLQNPYLDSCFRDESDKVLFIGLHGTPKNIKPKSPKEALRTDEPRKIDLVTRIGVNHLAEHEMGTNKPVSKIIYDVPVNWDQTARMNFHPYWLEKHRGAGACAAKGFLPAGLTVQ